MQKNYIWNPGSCSCENGENLGSIIDDSVVRCNEMMNVTKSVLPKTVQTKSTSTNFYILLSLYVNYHCIIDSC